MTTTDIVDTAHRDTLRLQYSPFLVRLLAIAAQFVAHCRSRSVDCSGLDAELVRFARRVDEANAYRAGELAFAFDSRFTPESEFSHDPDQPGGWIEQRAMDLGCKGNRARAIMEQGLQQHCRSELTELVSQATFSLCSTKSG